MGERFLGNISVWFGLFEKILVLLLTRKGEEHGDVKASLADEADGGARQLRVRHARLTYQGDDSCNIEILWNFYVAVDNYKHSIQSFGMSFG